VAGWATHLSGALGKYLDTSLGTPTAADLLLWHPDAPTPSFSGNATSAEIVAALEKLAEAAERNPLKVPR
jgi:hypothetical protein